jgi:hypothetical protein
LEAINGKHVDTETVTYEQTTECEICDIEHEAKKEAESDIAVSEKDL